MRVVTADGEKFELGTVETAPTIGITDYSRRVTDDFGITTVVERGFARRMSVRLGVPFNDTGALQRRLAGLRATAATWIADDRFAGLAVHGFYKDFEVDLAVPPLSYCTLTIEGVAETNPTTDTSADPAVLGRSTLQLLQPAIITPARLISSNVPQDDAPEWASQTTYPLGARIIKASTSRIYESTTNGNVANDPVTTTGKWVDIGPTNRWAMFDQALGSLTSNAASIVVVLDAPLIQAVALLDVTAATVRVQATGYDRTITVSGGTITFLDLPAGTTRVTVRITGATVSVGTLLVGKLVGLGTTEASPTAGITDYSRKDVDDFGEVTIVQRAWAKRMTAKALIKSTAVDVVANRIAAVRAVPSLWIGQDGLDILTVYGFFKDFSIEVGETISKLSLTIEGLSAAAKIEPLKVPVTWEEVGDPHGTKPDDNATDGAPAWSNIGGRPVPDVLNSIDMSIFNQVRATADAESARLRTRALNFLGPAGEPSYTLIMRETVARKDADGVFAETFEILGARTPDGIAFVLNVATVRIGDTESLGQRFEAIRAEFSGNAASIEEINQTIVTMNTAIAMRIDTISATVDGNSASIQRIDQAVVTLDQSVAQRMEALSATLNGATASIQRIDQVLVGPGGGIAQALVRLDAGGRVIGTALTNDGTVGRFIAAVDAFELVDPDTGKKYLYADAAGKVVLQDVEVDTLKIGSVKVDSMAIGAAQRASFYSLPSDVVISRGSTVEVASITFTKLDATSVLEVQMFGNMKSPDDLQFDTSILCDGMVMQQSQVNIVLDTPNSAGQMPITPFAFITGIAAGTRTVSFKVYNRETDNVSLSVLAGSTLKVVELRKGSLPAV